MTQSKINPLALGLSLGICWGIAVLVMGLMAYYFMNGESFVASVGTVSIGYKASILGSFLAGLAGFVYAFIGGLIFAWLYNLFSRYFINTID